MLAVALNPGLIVLLLEGLSVNAKAARIAGAKLSVVIGLFGGGGLFIGLAWLARTGRLRHSWAAHAAHLSQVARPFGAQVQQVQGLGVGFVTEVRGLRLEVVLDPDRRGAIWVRAHCPAQHSLEIWPLGMGPKTPSAGWEQVSAGASWELWAPVMMDGTGPQLTPSLRDALDPLFSVGGAAKMRHDSGGIEVELPHAKEQSPESRVTLGIDAVVAIARCNH